MINFLFFTLLLTGLFSILITNFVSLEDDYELVLDNSGPYIGAEFPKQLGFTGNGIKLALLIQALIWIIQIFQSRWNTQIFERI